MKNSFTTSDGFLGLDIKHGSSCDYHRITMPFSHIDIKPKVPVYAFNRISSLGLDALYRMKEQGVKIIMDIDDLPFLNPEHYLYESFKRSGMTHHIIANLKLADVIFTTTPLLASKLRGYNSNIVVIPNALPFGKGQFKESSDKDSKSTVVWVGGASHVNDLKIIKGVDFVEPLTFCGDAMIPGTNMDQWNIIKKNHPAMIYERGKSEKSYMDLYDGHAVSIAPLEDNLFNSCKSNLKVLESGCKGLPIICSKVEPYYNSIDKDFVIYAENKTEWHTQVNNMIKYKNYREDVGQALAEHVRLEYNLESANTLRKQVIESFN